MAKTTMIKAITQALEDELKRDKNVLVFGEDVGRNGGVFRATDGLQDKVGEDQVFDTPLAESGIGGLAVGLALTGFRPVPEIQFFGFVFEVMDEIAAQIARTRFRLGGNRKMPVTIRAPFGGGVHTPELHSDSLEGLMAQTPGLKVVIPSDPYDAKGLLTAAIRSDDPVVFLEHMKLYRSFKQEVPDEAYTVALDKAAIKREVVDLRTVSPLDEETILGSVKRTGRVVLVQEAQRQAGINSQVAALIAEKGILSLEAPIARVDAPDTPYPFSDAETIWLPNKQDIIEKVKETVNF